jgi:hypothetical protein
VPTRLEASTLRVPGFQRVPCVFLVLLAGPALGASDLPPVPDAGVEAATADEHNETLEAGREHLRNGAEWLARSVNNLFGDRPFEDGGRVTRGRLGVRTLWRQDDGVDLSVRLRARFDLPNLRDLAYLYFGQDNERELVTDRPEAFSRRQQLRQEQRNEEQTLFAGLGLALRDAVDLRIGVRSAYKPYAQARYRQQWQFSAADRMEFRETLFWTTSAGFGSTTAFEYEHAWSPTVALRWLNAATISHRKDDFAWSSSLGMFRRYGDERRLSLEALANGDTGGRHDVSEYGVRLKWQQPVYRDWLLGELIVGHFWPKDDDDRERERSWAAGAGLEVHF